MAKKIDLNINEEEADTRVLDKIKLKKPRRFCVIFHNDDFTTQEFVIHVLLSFFYKSQEEAHRLMLLIHLGGRTQVGTYSKDVAESKASVATTYCRQNDMPLLITVEPE